MDPDEVATLPVAGHDTLGRVVSVTETLNVHLAVFPPLSVVVQSTVVLPSAKIEPAGMLQIVELMPDDVLSAAVIV